MASNRVYPPTVQPGIPKIKFVPNGWKVLTFGDLVEVVSRPAEMDDDTKYQLVNAKRNRAGIVPRERLLGRDIKTKTQFFTETGDFLISRRQIVHGACGIVSKELHGSLVSNEYSTLRVTPNVELEFLRYLSHTIYFQQTCFHASVGVTVEKLIFRLDEWLRKKLIVPPVSEQKKIVDILATWDRAIELTEKLIAAKQKRKQALMQQLLTGKVRLPGFEKTKWKKCHLDDVAKNSTRRNGVPTDARTVYSVTNSVGMVPMDEGVIGESIDRYKTVSRFDFAYNPMRINVGSIAMWDGDDDVLVSPDYVVFRCGSTLDAQFLNHFRKTHYWRHFVTRAGGGSVRVRIYFSDLGGMKLNLPPVEEQKAIAGVLNAQDSEIDLLRRKLDALTRQKKGLMQQLLTGKIRVSHKPKKTNEFNR